jgi:anti-sigma factor RsiW
MNGPTSAPGCTAELVTLSQYLEGDLTPRKARALEQHLDRCTCCATLADSLRDAIARCRSADVRRIPADVRARARARVRALLATPPEAPTRPAPRTRRTR